KSGGQEATLLPPGSPCRPFVATVAVPQGHGVDSTAAGERGDNFCGSAAESVASARANATSTGPSRRRPGSSLRCRNPWWMRRGSGMDPGRRRGGSVVGDGRKKPTTAAPPDQSLRRRPPAGGGRPYTPPQIA